MLGDSTVASATDFHDLSSWGLPKKIVHKYAERGLKKMFPWQVECLSSVKLLAENRNIVYSAPTSAGKTLVAEILLMKTAFERRKKVMFVLPFVSVVREKMYYFQDLLAETGIRVEGFMGGSSPIGGFASSDVAIATIEKANSILNQMLENDALAELGAVVIDELHLIGDSHRGYLLELLLTKLKYMALRTATAVTNSTREFKVQLIGMSATLPNLDLLANWLDAELYKTDYRPVPLRELCKIGSTIYDCRLKIHRKLSKLQELEELNIGGQGEDCDTEDVIQLCLETIDDGHSILIFCPTKSWCEKLAERISQTFFKLGRDEASPIGRYLRRELRAESIVETLEQLKRCPIGLDTVLRRVVGFAVGFHHAGLTMDERDVVEGAFRSGAIRVLTATSTLSSGVNLPARRVIVRSLIFHGRPIDTLTYRQMIGRAGRMGKDTAGESIIICKSNEKRMVENLLSAQLQPIESCLVHGNGSSFAQHLVRALLEAVASEIAYTERDIDLYVGCTLAGFASDDEKRSAALFQRSTREAMTFLVENELLMHQKTSGNSEETRWIATSLGKACLAASVPPSDGLSLFRELQKARRCIALDTELHIVYLVTPINSSSLIGQIDWISFLDLWKSLSESERRVGRLVGIDENFVTNSIKSCPRSGKNLDVHKRFYTALVLYELVKEIPLSQVCRKYGCCRGVVQGLQQSAATFAGMVTQFCSKLGWNSMELLIGEFQTRLQFGVNRELLDLLRLPMLNGLRARSLFKENIKTVGELALANQLDVERALHKALPFESGKEIEGEDAYEAAKRNKTRCVFVTGRDGMTPREAAFALVREARDFVRNELGLEEVNWESKSKNAPLLAEESRKTRQDSSNFHRESASSPSLFGDSNVDSEECNLLEQNVIDPSSLSIFGETNYSGIPVETEAAAVKENEESMPPAFPIPSTPPPPPSAPLPSSLKSLESLLVWGDDSWNNTGVIIETLNEMKAITASMTEKKRINECAKTPTLLKESPATENRLAIKRTSKNRLEQLREIDTNRKMNEGSSEKSPIAGVTNYVGKTETLAIPRFSVDSNDKSDSEGAISFSQNIEDSSEGGIKKNRTRMKIESLRKSRTMRGTTTATKRRILGPLNLDNFTSNESLAASVDSNEAENDTKSIEKRNSPRFALPSTRKKFIGNLRTAVDSPIKIQTSSIQPFSSDIRVVNVANNWTLFNSFKRELTEKKDVSLSLGCEAFARDTITIGSKIIGIVGGADGKKKSRKIENSTYGNKQLSGIAISWDGASVNYISFENNQESKVPVKKRLEFLVETLKDPKLRVRCFSAKETYKMLYSCCGIVAGCKFLDPKVGDWLLDPDSPERSFKSMLTEYLGELTFSLLRRLGDACCMGNVGPGMNVNGGISSEIRATTEAAVVWFLTDALTNKLRERSATLLKTFVEVEMATLIILARMELTGLGVNHDSLRELSQVIQGEMSKLEEKAYSLAGRKFNFSSSKSVAQILGLYKGKKVSTSKAVLENCQDPISSLIVSWRKLSTTQTKVVYPLLNLSESSSRIHGNCVTNTSTGRVSMHEPNLQNIPRDFSSEDQSFVLSVRMAFSPILGNVMLSADYCQLELRILAHFSKEAKLCEILREEGDVFKNIAARWYNVTENQIDDLKRQRTKQLCYGMIYGMGAKSLAENLSVSENEARDFLETFMGAYPGIRKWLTDVVARARSQGYVRTLMKRRRYFPALKSDVPSERSQAERQAVNTKIQGSAADITKKSMVIIDERMRNEFSPSPLVLIDHPVKMKLRSSSREPLPRGGFFVLQIHDELLYEVNAADLHQVGGIIKESMEKSYDLRVPLPVKIKIGPTWGDLTEYKFETS